MMIVGNESQKDIRDNFPSCHKLTAQTSASFAKELISPYIFLGLIHFLLQGSHFSA